MRVDLALHLLRLYPSRSAAQAAIDAGHVRLNGNAVKPSREAHAGDRLTLTSSAGAVRALEIVTLPRKGLSKAAAAECWREVAPSG